MPLNWSSIRPLNGGRDKGFEELCAQLARAEVPPGTRFERKGTPDAGVECFAVFRDGSEWGWQAKYFNSFGNSQWAQINESVKTAIEKHPKLVQYFVCIPRDRPDARIEGQKSAMEKWDEHVVEWKRQASKKGMNVEFTFWGSSELLDRLSRPENIGRLRFWFDVHGFDAAWFSARLDEAIRTAGPRYTPEVHFDLPIAMDIEAFGRTDRFFDRMKGQARAIRKELSSLENSKDIDNADVITAMTSLSEKVQEILIKISAIKEDPTGSLVFKAIAGKIQAAEKAGEELSLLLDEREREIELKSDLASAEAPRTSHRRNPFRDCQPRLFRLISELRTSRKSLIHADSIASNALMILRGEGGSGKTHLLCDIAKKRIAEGRPTILLTGQRFVSDETPWSQALQQLDLRELSAEKFVGAFEAAAQAAGSKALLMIDALNEGNGRNIWPSHLAAFLAQLERSPWIGVVLAIRSTYEELIIPEEVRTRAISVTHHGFMGHEYDATKTFFVHFGLELPSTPLLAPEFRSPLFLKTLCQGLNGKGEHRLPRGFHGITAVFNLYLTSINKRLASNLDFNERTPRVYQALEAVVKAILDSGKTCLPLTKAEEIANSFLPERGFDRSLYRGLVAEGLLVEEAIGNGREIEEVVFIGYERFYDHLTAKLLLERHLDRNDPTAAFVQGGPLAFVFDQDKYVSPGLLEALCIQVPEKIGRELISIAPTCSNRWGLEDAFRQSLVWRASSAFFDETFELLNKFCQTRHDLSDFIDVMLTVATLPEHPLNAQFLDRLLCQDAMPDRDAWWSVYLHHAWGSHDAVDRLVDWASSLDPTMAIDDEVIDLCALTLSWMLTTSNRFLRDRATKALVNLLTSRLAAAVRLVERFADVDDPYVVERVYAVAYGVAMRSHDPAEVGVLAKCVYEHIFASGSPPPHILLRDYARGVVERALYLGSVIDVIPNRIRPPYKSTFPTIPTDEDIKPLLPDSSKGSYDSGNLEWGRYRIELSVMNDDFARYVIGTNWSPSLGNWLSLRLDEPPWRPPPRIEDQLSIFVGDLSVEEKKAWDEFDEADKAVASGSPLFVLDGFTQPEIDGRPDGLNHSDLNDPEEGLDSENHSEIAELEEKRRILLANLEATLTVEHAQRFEEIWGAKKNDNEARRPPPFDLSQIQRYILKRVFDLGWTESRFGKFDRFSIEIYGREDSKAERIGKKYQWIAYHEIMAFVSDHFQYREQFREEDGHQSYEGPWQENIRDIDPSCTLRTLRGGTSWDGHSAAWWGPSKYDSWGDPNNPRDWVLNREYLPKIDDLLIVTNPMDESCWLNGKGYFNWKQQTPADQESVDVERREIWYLFFGYLLRAEEAQTFLEWAEKVNFDGRWMPEGSRNYKIFLGEYPWAPASRYFQHPYYGDDGWTQPRFDCPVKIRPIEFEYLRERGFDCSIDETYSLSLPVSDLVSGLDIWWSGRGADFVDQEDNIVAQDPTVHADGPSSLLLRKDSLLKFLDREKLTICWSVIGEKRVIPPGFGRGPHHPVLRMSGAYVFSEGRTRGFVNYLEDDPDNR